MAFSTCDTGKTRLDFADVRHACRLSPAQIGVGNVESTPIGFVQNGANVTGYLPTELKRSRCKSVKFKSVEGPC